MNKYLEKFLNKSLSENSNVVYKTAAIIRILISAAWHRASVEERGRKGPNGDTVFYRLEADMNTIFECFKKHVDTVLDKLPSNFFYAQHFLAVDETYEPYFGKKKNAWIHGYKPEKGCTGCYKYLVISLVGCNFRIVLWVIPCHIGMNKTDELKKALRWIRKRIKVKVILFDRGFYCAGLIEMLRRNSFYYIILVPKNKKMKQYLDADYEEVLHAMKINENKTNRNIRIKIRIARQKFGYDWIFATNVKLQRAIFIVKWYKKRWGIENIFKVTDFIRLSTKSPCEHVKYLFFTISIVIYNLWKTIKDELDITLRLFTEDLVNNFNFSLLSKEKRPPDYALSFTCYELGITYLGCFTLWVLSIFIKDIKIKKASKINNEILYRIMLVYYCSLQR